MFREALHVEPQIESLLEDQEILIPHDGFAFVRAETPNLFGQIFGEADIRNVPGYTVIAVQRDGELQMELGLNFVIEAGDVVIAPRSIEEGHNDRNYVLG